MTQIAIVKYVDDCFLWKSSIIIYKVFKLLITHFGKIIFFLKRNLTKETESLSMIE